MEYQRRLGWQISGLYSTVISIVSIVSRQEENIFTFVGVKLQFYLSPKGRFAESMPFMFRDVKRQLRAEGLIQRRAPAHSCVFLLLQLIGEIRHM